MTTIPAASESATGDSIRRTGLFVVLCALALAGNYANLPLFFSVSIIFGSIFSLTALGLLGLWPGVIAAAIGGAYTFFIWGHPYAAIIFTAEAFCVGLLIRRGLHMPLADLIYWVVVGAPLVMLFYWGQLGMNFDAAGLIALKQPVNGIFNAVIAAILMTVIRMYLPSFSFGADKQGNISRLMFNLILLLTIVAGAVPMIIESRILGTKEEGFAEQLLITNGKWLKSELGQIMPDDETEMTDPERMSAIETAVASISLPDDMLEFGLFDENGSPVLSSGDIRSRSSTGTTQRVTEQLFIWRPPGDMPSMLRWRQSRYLVSAPLYDDRPYPEIVIEYTAGPLVAKLDQQSARLLGVISVLILLAVLAALVFSRWLTRPVLQLNETSQDLVQSVTRESPVPVSFPRSRIGEYDELSVVLETTSRRLAEAFAELNDMRSSLEDEVKDRTRDLRRMSMVARQTQSGVVVTDRKGNTLWVNDAFTLMTGFTLDELTGRKPGDLLQGPETSPETVETIRQAIDQEESFSVEILNYTKSRTPYWVEIIANPQRDDDGNVEGFIAIETNVSERKRLEKNKEEFISSVSHELRTPLTSINGSLSLIQGGAMGEVPDGVAKTIDIAKRNTERLMALVNDILDVQRILSGELNLEIREIDAGTLLDAAIEENKSYADQHKVTVTANNDTVGLSLLGDEHRLMQVMANLISNAIKFSPDGSTVRLAANAHEDYVRISVTDQGPGISEEFRSRIFGRFAQADSSDSKEKGGTGLGLNISRGIIEEHGGRISFDNPQDGGARFYFDIPLSRDRSPN